jgi:hypothetical protein
MVPEELLLSELARASATTTILKPVPDFLYRKNRKKYHWCRNKLPQGLLFY